jgi:hypothetical protein
MAGNIEKCKNVKSTLRDLEYDKKTEKRGKVTPKLFDLEYGGKHSKTWKIRNAHYQTWNMARKLKIIKNEKRAL